MKLSERLKEATTSQHRELEASMYSENITNATITIQQYKEMLEVLHSIIKPFEEQWRQVAEKNEEIMLLWQERWKTDLLEEDLEHLGKEYFHYDKELFHNWNYHQLLGAAYVIEGSTLGGKIICKALNDNPAIPNNIMRYFNHNSHETGSRWKSFKHFLNANQENEDDTIEGAVNTFKLLADQSEYIKRA